jgi:hypothetical protein
MNNDFACEFCGTIQNTLYEGWFRTPAAFNEFAQGTASAGLLQLRRVCKKCCQQAIKNMVAVAKELPQNV